MKPILFLLAAVCVFALAVNYAPRRHDAPSTAQLPALRISEIEDLCRTIREQPQFKKIEHSYVHQMVAENYNQQIEDLTHQSEKTLNGKLARIHADTYNGQYTEAQILTAIHIRSERAVDKSVNNSPQKVNN